MNVVSASDAVALAGFVEPTWDPPHAVVADVAAILAGVRERRDEALVEYTRRFDDGGCVAAGIRIPIPMVTPARGLVAPEIARALELAKDRAVRFYERQRQPDVRYDEDDGSRYALCRRPLRSVAIYAQRSSPATAVLTAAVPAAIAGVSRVVVLSPGAAGPVSPALLFACALCGVDELYAVGGAQAIGAAAYGTESIAPVEKIVGRGGVWTTEAKRQVFGRCGIDALCGPADALVVADDGANSEYVVGELLAQAERGGIARLAVLSESRPLLEAVAQLIDSLDPPTLERGDVVGGAIADRCRLVAANGREELYAVLNRFAPGYLCLQVRDAAEYLAHVVTAGAVFAGDMTPLVAAEYLSGTPGAVPTGGTARFASASALADFTRTFSVVENSTERMTADAALLAALAERDELPHHAQAARMRSGS